MKLIEALNLVKGMELKDGGTARCFLGTGLNTLHLKTFLTAELCQLFPAQKIEILDGLYGDCVGNIDRIPKSHADFGIVLIEWPDLDSRLGIRSSARWSQVELIDIVSTVRSSASQISRAIEEVSQHVPLVLCGPTLPLPPFSCVPGWQAGALELELKCIVESVLFKASQCQQVRVVSSQRIDMVSPPSDRHDVESEVLTGFPYRLAHASTLAKCLADSCHRPATKKGLITDLDDTLWRGILGEDGIDGVSWDLDHHSQMHAFYQRFLGALASEGVLIAVASKNDPLLVEDALKRDDLALSRSAIFPVAANWGPKSQSVTQILKAWNVGADSVVMIDDSLLELAEVKAAHPEVECIQFLTGESSAIYNLVSRLRDLFGKSAILEEDLIRIESIRRSVQRPDASNAATATRREFLQDVEAEVTFNFSKMPLDPRALDLVNKTNQFNLNGKRYSEAAWYNYFLDPASVLLVASYRDKFGPLGKIAVIAGRRNGKKMIIDAWVMSCRAFSRKIEYKCLAELIARYDLDEIEFEYLRTERNGPLGNCLSEISGMDPSPGCTVSRETLERRLMALLETQEVTNG